jgi:precorrin-6B methylase 2
VIPTLVHLLASVQDDAMLTLVSLTLESLDAILKCNTVLNQYGLIIQNMFNLEDIFAKMEEWKTVGASSNVSKMVVKVLDHLEKIKSLHVHVMLHRMLKGQYSDIIII